MRPTKLLDLSAVRATDERHRSARYPRRATATAALARSRHRPITGIELKRIMDERRRSSTTPNSPSRRLRPRLLRAAENSTVWVGADIGLSRSNRPRVRWSGICRAPRYRVVSPPRAETAVGFSTWPDNHSTWPDNHAVLIASLETRRTKAAITQQLHYRARRPRLRRGGVGLLHGCHVGRGSIGWGGSSCVTVRSRTRARVRAHESARA